jgi:threonine aldolase
MDFGSDNAAGVHPAILDALAAVAGPEPVAYDADRVSQRLDAAFSDLFGTRCRVFAMPSGTAANGIGLAALVPPWGGVWCHEDAHIDVDEAGAVPFFTGGASLLKVAGEHGRLTVDRLSRAAARRRSDVHQVQPAALSVTQATEAGTCYSPDDLAALGRWAREQGLGFHMDGARFANAVAHFGCHPADLSWRAGVDLLAFGFIKNGGLSAEALVVFNEEAAKTVPVRRKRAGMMPSKGRFAAAQLLALLEDGRWLDNARAANAGGQAIAAAAPGRVRHPVQANEVFMDMTAAQRAALRAAGYIFYDWELDGPDVARFVVRWDQDGEAIDALARAIGELG